MGLLGVVNIKVIIKDIIKKFKERLELKDLINIII